MIALGDGVAAQDAVAAQQAGSDQQRVAGLVGLDAGRREIRLLGIGAGVAEEAYAAHMQEHRPPPGACDMHRLACRPPGIEQVEAIAGQVVNAGA